MLPQKAGFHAGRQGIKFGTNGHMERREVETLKVLKSGQALLYQGYWKNIDLMRSNENVLYYQATTDGSLCYCHEKLSGSKKPMERITVLCCSNLTGTDKCTPCHRQES